MHPEDIRYREFVGKKNRCDLGRVVPVLPILRRQGVRQRRSEDHNQGHDFNDFETARALSRQISIFDADGKSMPAGYGPGETATDRRYSGQDSMQGRKQIVAELKDRICKSRAHRSAVVHCYRCQTVIEPYLTPQWFVDIKPCCAGYGRVRDGPHPLIPKLE